MTNEQRDSSPPKAALRILSWFCPEQLYEEIEGDLIYQFNKDLNAGSERQAKRKLMRNVLRFFRRAFCFEIKFQYTFIRAIC